MRFMHIADVHLGYRPDIGYSWSSMRSREIWDTFRSMIDDARRESVDLLLIAGDLFENPPTEQELREVDYLFHSLPKTRVVLIAGNHDHLEPGCAYLHHEWGTNVVCLFSTKCECVRFPEIETEVYGFSYDRKEMPEPMLDSLQPAKGKYCHILLAHGGDAKHVPFHKQTLEASGFDYIALGHIHQPQMLIRNKAAYPGCPEALECNDLGERGYILGEWHAGHIAARFIPKTKRQYHLMELNCRREDTTFSLQDAIAEAIDRYGREDIYRIILKGSHAPGSVFDIQRLMQSGMILNIEDQTQAEFDIEELRRDYRGTLIGRYIESFDDEKDDPVKRKALMIGLEALLGNRKDGAAAT